MERILDEFADFDDPPPIERDETPSARRMRNGRKGWRILLRRASAKNALAVDERRQSRVGITLPKVNLPEDRED